VETPTGGEIVGAGDMFDQAKDALSGQGDKVDEIVDQADQAVKDKTPDQADPTVDQIADKAKDL
jgi:MT0933-like antitoxin protein